MKRLTLGDRVMTICNYLICFLAACVTAYPLLYIFSMSISDPAAVISNQVVLFPKGFSLDAYQLVFKSGDIWSAYYNTVIYTVFSTLLSMILTLLAAYPLSRKHFCLRRPLSVFFVLSMFFTGTLIPMYILINRLGLYNTRWAIILPTGAAAYYIIMARTFLSNIPESLYESAKLDGAGEMTILRRIFIPLSMPLVAVLILYYAVQQWNSYFNAMVYLPSKNLQPLQLYLMKVLINNESAATAGAGLSMSMLSLQLKYVVIVVALLPILCVYPYLQKYFTKGMMIGAVKE